MKALLLFCIFTFIVLFLNLVAYFLTSKRRRLYQRLKETVNKPAPYTVSEDKTPKTAKKYRLFKQVSMPRKLTNLRWLSEIQNNLGKAGIPLKTEEFLLLQLLSGVIGFIIGRLFLKIFLLTLLFTLIGLFIPTLWVGIAKKRRVIQIESQLLDVVTLIANALRAGHSFHQALELVSRETMPPLATELSKALKEVKVGITLETALNNLVQRVESKELELVVTGVLIQRQVGGNLAEVLDNIAATIEKRIKMRAKVKALTAQGKLSAVIVSLLPFLLGLFIFGRYPKFAQIMISEPIGVIMLACGLAMLVIGILVIRKVVDVDV